MSIRSCGGGKYKVVSKSGKNLSRCTSRKQAAKRLRQVEFFKRRGR